METRFWLSRVLFSAAAVFLGTACPALNQAEVGDDESTGDSGGTATTLPTTAGMTMTTADMTMTGDGSGGATSSDGGTTMSASATDGTTTDDPTTDGETTVGEETGPGATTEGSGESTSTGDPTTGEPCEPMGAGDYANCMDGANCNSGSAACIDLGEGDGVCTFQCDDVCDCPPAPGGATVACDDVAGDGGNDCYLSCEGDAPCPTDMECFGNMICAYSNSPYGYYESCNNGSDCPPDAFCGYSGDFSTCVDPDCDVASDCPDPPPGGTVVCANGFTGTPGSIECYLDCSGPLECPDGWTCVGSICMQEDP